MVKTLLAGAWIMICAVITVQAGLPLAESGRPAAEIIRESGRKPAAIRYASEELSLWIEKISGAKIPILEKPQSAKTKIYIGTPESSPSVAKIAEKYKDDYAKLKGNDGFLIRTEGDSIYIIGSIPKGVLNGTYRFLEKSSDIIFVRPQQDMNGFGTVYGKNPDMKAGIENLLDVPLLPSARFWTGDVSSLRWQARNLNRFNYAFNTVSAEMYPGLAEIGTDFTCSMGLTGIIPAGKYSESHPEFFPLINGKRNWDPDHHLCFMNQEMIKAAAGEVESIASGMPKKIILTGFGMGDHGLVCQCPLCTVPIKLEGGTVVNPKDENFRSTQYALFANGMSKLLVDKFPDIQISAGGYLFTSIPPAVKLEKNVGLMYCPYPKNHKFPVYHEKNKIWRDRAEGWAKIGPISGLYEYYMCTTTPLFYHAVGEVVQKDIEYYFQRGLNNMYLDATRHDSQNGYSENIHDMSGIEYYVISRLMWDYRQNVDELRREFCRRAYREAAGPMYEYYSKLAEVYNKSEIGCYWNDHPNTEMKRYVVSNNLIDECLEKLDRAEKTAVHPASRELIARHRARFINLLPHKEIDSRSPGLNVPLTADAPSDFSLEGGEWTGAAFIDVLWNVGRKPPKVKAKDDSMINRSMIKIMHDEKNLYIGWRLFTPPGVHRKVAREAYPPGTAVEIFLSPENTPNGEYFQFVFDNAGNQFSAKGLSDNPTANWTVTTSVISPNSWSGIAKIPLSEIGVKSGNSPVTVYAMFHDPAAMTSWYGEELRDRSKFHKLVLDRNLKGGSPE